MNMRKKHNEQDNEETNNSKDLKNMKIKSILEEDGGLPRSHGETCCGIKHIRPCQISGSNTMIGSATTVGILGDPHPGLNSCDFSVQRCFFACWKFEFPGSRRKVQTHTPAARHIFVCTVIAQHRRHAHLAQV